MMERATELARALIDVASGLRDVVARHVIDWVKGGDVTLIIILGSIGLILLLTIVVPSRRRY